MSHKVKSIVSGVDGVPSGAPPLAAGPQRSLGAQIVVLDRGFVYYGQVSLVGEREEFVRIEQAQNVRRWGTTKGLGELRDGPKRDTVLDEAGEVLAPLKAVIHFIKCNKPW
jgi:hypothetical protein